MRNILLVLDVTIVPAQCMQNRICSFFQDIRLHSFSELGLCSSGFVFPVLCRHCYVGLASFSLVRVACCSLMTLLYSQ